METIWAQRVDSCRTTLLSLLIFVVMISTSAKLEQLINTLPVRRTNIEGTKREEFEWNQVGQLRTSLRCFEIVLLRFLSGKVQRNRWIRKKCRWRKNTFEVGHAEYEEKGEKQRRADLCFGTFQSEGARLFWSMISRIHVESHPILCWKFCYVFHRVLREGHRHVSTWKSILSLDAKAWHSRSSVKYCLMNFSRLGRSRFALIYYLFRTTESVLGEHQSTFKVSKMCLRFV